MLCDPAPTRALGLSPACPVAVPSQSCTPATTTTWVQVSAASLPSGPLHSYCRSAVYRRAAGVLQSLGMPVTDPAACQLGGPLGQGEMRSFV